MKKLLPLAASNSLTTYFKTLGKNVRNNSTSSYLEISVTPSGSCVDMMNNVNRDHTVCFKMNDSRHYYNGLAVRSHKNSNYDWLRDVYDCYSLFSRSLYGILNHFTAYLRWISSANVLNRLTNSIVIRQHIFFMVM